MKTAKMVIDNHKSPDGWNEMLYTLGLYSEDEESPLVERYFDFGEYASVEIEVDENLNIIGGRFLPRK